jgi:hypothetical protein
MAVKITLSVELTSADEDRARVEAKKEERSRSLLDAAHQLGPEDRVVVIDGRQYLIGERRKALKED